MELNSNELRRIRNHRGVVWQKSMELAEGRCRVAWAWPPRAHPLASHIQRTAISIPSNMAEGHELQTGSIGFTYASPSGPPPNSTRSSRSLAVLDYSNVRQGRTPGATGRDRANATFPRGGTPSTGGALL